MKKKSLFLCLNCQNQFSQWSGKCSVCGEWNTIVEQTEAEPEAGLEVADQPAQLVELGKITGQPAAPRIPTKLTELDRVLGGDQPGIVPGSVILLAGNPGIGKSTLLLQVGGQVANTLYFSAEESLEQVGLRATRLGLMKASLHLAAERRLGSILAAVKQNNPSLVIIDSIQTIYDDQLPSSPGSLVQVRENCWRFQQFAKQLGIAIVIVSHVTKEGTVAGPKVLEHLVDVVLYLEGERRTGLRLLRSEKNRYGSTEEVGIMQLTEKGFEAIEDPGKVFASLITEDVPGRSLSITVEGSRAFLIEVQALVTKTGFGYPKRTSQGVDLNRLTLIIAVLENRLALPLNQYDIYINVVGGFTIKDPGIDLAIAAAIVSSLKKKILPENQVLLGEIGLLGEIRPAAVLSSRLKEAKRLKYQVVDSSRSITELKRLFKEN